MAARLTPLTDADSLIRNVRAATVLLGEQDCRPVRASAARIRVSPAQPQDPFLRRLR
jgi:hypothetical protein